LKNPEELFTTFLKEKTFLQGVSESTIRLYFYSWIAFKRYDGEIIESGAKEFIKRVTKLAQESVFDSITEIEV
jgi:hypothetical protein